MTVIVTIEIAFVVRIPVRVSGTLIYLLVRESQVLEVARSVPSTLRSEAGSVWVVLDRKVMRLIGHPIP